ncbi:hypothetical protein [Pandoravirus japonicus]|uniref:Uncharacterized protein n=1 Tax=Pandoravirus japonicus TaxID=2823154 RepID=A0A811BPI1_9VIRU|nr:hypothetical protein [Pandoravirus japonicus]
MGAHASTAAPRRTAVTGVPTRETPTYIDRETDTAHACAPGDRVILDGAALHHARAKRLSPVATVIGHVTDRGRPMMRLCLYADAPVARSGDVGRPVEEILVPAGDGTLARPLPIYVYAVAPDEVRQRALAFWAWNDALSAAADDADPDRRLQAACACPSGVRETDHATAAHGRAPSGQRHAGGGLDRDVVLSAITAHTPEGVTRRTTLVCEGADAQAEASASDPARCARPVVIATAGLPGGISRYGIVPLSPERTVQSAALCAYGLPLTPAFYQAVEWDRWPEYTRLVDEAVARHGATVAQRDPATGAVGVDSVWLYRLVSDLVDRGYRLSPIDLGAPATA